MACAASMAMSSNLIDMNHLQDVEACFKVGSHLDFFRGDPARIHIPAILDDSDLRAETMASLKAFMDVSAEDAKVMARYTTSSFCKHQPRLLCTNTYNNAEEPDVFIDPANNNDTVIDHDTFMRMLRVAFNSQAYDEDIAALLKRCVMVIFGTKNVYLRLPSPAKVNAKVITYPPSGKDLLTAECKERFALYKAGEAVQAPVSDSKWATAFVRKAIRGEKFRGFYTTMAAECPFTGVVTPERNTKPSFDIASLEPLRLPGQPGSSSDGLPHAWTPAAAPPLPRNRAFKRSFSQMASQEIDISSPPKTRPAAREEASSSSSMAPQPVDAAPQPANEGGESALARELADLMDNAPTFNGDNDQESSD